MIKNFIKKLFDVLAITAKSISKHATIFIFTLIYLFGFTTEIEAVNNCLAQYVVPCKDEQCIIEDPERNWVENGITYIPSDIKALKYYFLVKDEGYYTVVAGQGVSQRVFGRTPDYFANPFMAVRKGGFLMATGIITNYYSWQFKQDQLHELKLYKLANNQKPDIKNLPPAYCDNITYFVGEPQKLAPLQDRSICQQDQACFIPGAKCPVECPAKYNPANCDTNAGLTDVYLCTLTSNGAVWQPTNPECRTECVDKLPIKTDNGRCEWIFKDVDDNIIRPPFALELKSPIIKFEVKYDSDGLEDPSFDLQVLKCTGNTIEKVVGRECIPAHSVVINKNKNIVTGESRQLYLTGFALKGKNAESTYCQTGVYWNDSDQPSADCNLSVQPNNITETTSKIKIITKIENLRNITYLSNITYGKAQIHYLNINLSGPISKVFDRILLTNIKPGSLEYELNIGSGYKPGTYSVQATANLNGFRGIFPVLFNTSCSTNFTVAPAVPDYCYTECLDEFTGVPICTDRCSSCPNCPDYEARKERTFASPLELKEICGNVRDSSEKNVCIACVTGEETNGVKPSFEGPGAYTAIGCLPTDLPTFIGGYVFTIGLGIGGGVGFLLMLWGAFTILISAGNPEQIKHGQEIIVSALAGLLLIVFSVLILKVIGVDILKIPGFT